PACVVLVRETKLDRHIAAFDETCFVQAFAERRNDTCAQLRHAGVNKSHHRHHCLLRTRRQRPRCRRAPEQRDELAAPHSITSSARASTVVGTSRPSVLAVFRLIVSTYLVGACTGRSAGFSPLRMRST